MKSYEDIAKSVLKKSEERMAEKKRGGIIFGKKAAIASGLCAACLCGIGFWKLDSIRNSMDKQKIPQIVEIQPTTTFPTTTAAVTSAVSSATTTTAVITDNSQTTQITVTTASSQTEITSTVSVQTANTSANTTTASLQTQTTTAKSTTTAGLSLKLRPITMLNPKNFTLLLHLSKDILSKRFYKIFHVLSTFFYNYFASCGEANHSIWCFFHQFHQIRINKYLLSTQFSQFNHMFHSSGTKI